MVSIFTKTNYLSIRKISRPLCKLLNFHPLRDFHCSGIQNVSLKSKWRAPVLKEMKKRVDLLKAEGKYPVTIRSRFLEWNYDSELYAFGKRLNETFDDQLLKQAFINDSYIHEEIKKMKNLGIDESKLDLKSNREMDVTGRALIEDFGMKFLRGIFPLLPEEGVENLVQHLVSDKLLSSIAKELGFRDLILTMEYPPSDPTYAKCFSSVVTCLNVSSGLERCQRFIIDFVITQLVGKDLWDIWEIDDPYHHLRNILLRSGLGEPEPRLLGNLGPHTLESVFYVGIYDENKQLVGKGYGEKMDIAIKVAAYDALSRLFDHTGARAPLPFDQKEFAHLMKMEPNQFISSWKTNR